MKSGEKTERTETILLSRVVTDFALVDTNHARELGESMSLERGQISPIVVRPRLNSEDGQIVYDVIDGFHRTEGQRQLGAETIKAIVVYGCGDEELYDLRILAASSVKSVQFPRIAEWITRSYEQTRWKQRGLSVLQAFTVTVNDREKSYLLKEDKELTELKEWVRNKCKAWQKSKTYVLNVLKIVDVADPDLVKQVRVSGGGKDREGKVTPARLEKIALAFPGKQNFKLQNELMHVSVANRMSADETALLVEIVQSSVTGLKGVHEIKRVIQEAVSEVNYRMMMGKTAKKAADEDDSGELEGESVDIDDEVEPAVDGLDAGETPESSLPPESHNGRHSSRMMDMDALADQIAREAMDMKTHGIDHDDDDDDFRSQRSYSVFDDHFTSRRESLRGGVNFGEDIEAVRRERDDLKRLVENNVGSSRGWWVTADYLHANEKSVLIALFSEGKNVDQVCTNLRLTSRQLEALIRSALTRKQYHEQRQEA